MPKRNSAFYIVDIFIALDKINRYTSAYNDEQELLHAEQSWDATIRELEIVGEATKHLLSEGLLPTKYRRIVDFRNQINHAYFGIDEKIVWDVICNKLPEYKDELITTIKDNGINLQKAIDKIKEEKYTSEKTLLLLSELENI